MDPLDRQLRYFLKIAELSSLSKAAEELDVSQSGLSRQLASLEAFLGQALFTRTGRGVTLTEAGKRLQQGTEQHYAQIDAALEAAKITEGGQEGSLRVATIHTLSHYFANLLTKFVSQHRRVNLSVMARSSPGVVELVEKGKADIGFVYDSAVASETLTSVTLFDDKMCFIVQKGRYPADTRINLHDAEIALVGFPEDYALRRMLKSADLDGVVVAEANTIDAMLQLVSLGIGGCILPEHTPSGLLDDHGLTKLPLAEPLLQRRVVAIVRNTGTVPSLAQQLLEMAAGFPQ
ncbi:MAG TPA: LysR family transcriptional regulator [Burkholderiaceae bacterium]|nr:LysR family transcriptional regulator [Burkholderiaceae bacterium]